MRKWLFFTLLGLSIVFFLVSLISWNLLLGACSFVIAIGLTRFLDDAGITGNYSSKEVKKELKRIRSQKSEVEISEGIQ
jgi:hypothetical protein